MNVARFVRHESPDAETDNLLLRVVHDDLAVVHPMHIRHPIADGYLHAGA